MSFTSQLERVWEEFETEIGTRFAFDGKDAAYGRPFLWRIVDLADCRGIGETLLCLWLPRLVSDNAEDLFSAAITTSSASSRPIINWPTAVNYLLTTSAQ